MINVARDFSFTDEVTSKNVRGRMIDEVYDFEDAKDIKKAKAILMKHHKDQDLVDLLVDGATENFKITSNHNLLYV